MKGIIVLITLFCIVLMLGGCGITAKQIGKADREIAQIVQGFDKNISVDCRAGLAAGLTIAPDTSAAIRGTVTALNSVADTNSADYKKCFGLGAWTSFVIHGVDDITDKILLELATMGLLK